LKFKICMSQFQLSRGFCEKVLLPGGEDLSGIVRMENISCISGSGMSGKYKADIFDGRERLTTTLSTQIVPLIVNNSLKNNTIFRIDKSMISTHQGKGVVVLLKGAVLGEGDVLPMNSPPPTSALGGLNGPPAYGTINSFNSNNLPPQQQPQAAYGQYPPQQLYPPQQQYSTQQQYPTPQQQFMNAPTASPYSTSGGLYNNPPPYQATNVNYTNPTNIYNSGQPARQESNYLNPPSGRPVTRNDYMDAGKITPISAINPYSQKWTIKARITSKSDIKKWSNAKGEGTVFSIDLLDAENTEIRGTFFKEACEKFFPMLEQGKVYTFSGGQLKLVQNKQFNNLKNQYEIMFSVQSEIRAVIDDSNIKPQTYSFVKINALNDCDVNSTVDLVAVVRDSSEVVEINSKTGNKALQKRDVTLIDDTLTEVRLTLWGEKAVQLKDLTGRVIALKGVKVGDYGGRNLGMLNSSSLVINPNLPEALALFNWQSQYVNTGYPAIETLSTSGTGAGSADLIEKRKWVSAIRDESMGMGEKPDYITIKASVNYIKHDTDGFYIACPTPGCNKKVTDLMNGGYRCEKCNKEFDSCLRRYILSIQMADFTGNSWFSVFNDAGEKMLGCTAQHLYELKSGGNDEAYEKVFADALFKTHVVKVRVKQETVNDEMRVKSTVMTMNDVDILSECKQMLNAIEKYAVKAGK